MVGLLVLAACGSTKDPPLDIETDLTHPNPSRRMEAIAAIDQSRDATHVPALIEMLDDADPGIRLAAYRTLQDLTGRTTDYRPWASQEVLRAEVEDWRRWWATR